MRPKKGLLLDTHVLVWVLVGSTRVGKRLQQALVESDRVFYSPLSLAELQIKERLGKFSGVDVVRRRSSQLEALAFDVESADAMRAENGGLPGDPFDQMLLAQATAHDCWLRRRIGGCSPSRKAPAATQKNRASSRPSGNPHPQVDMQNVYG